jgi:transaldolase
MKLLLESAAGDDIRWAATFGAVDGVHVTPAALDADAFGVPLAPAVEAVVRSHDGPCYVTVEAVAADEMLRDARELARLDDHVIPVVPAIEDGLVALRRLADEGVRAAAALVHAPGQALLAARAGAHGIFVAADLLDLHGGDALAVVSETRRVFDRAGAPCDLLVAVSEASPQLAVAAIAAGADGVALRPDALRQLLTHPLADRAVDGFLRALTRRPRAPRGPA